MLKACLDTSSSVASFVLYKDGQEILSLSEECHKGASKLLPYINSKIQENGIKIHEINHWKIGIGPGSFTGMRVGIAYVKGVCYASGASFEGINSGYAFLYNLTGQAPDLEKVSVLHDGRRQEVICNTFERLNGSWSEMGTEVIAIVDLQSNSKKLGSFVSNMNPELFPEGLRDSILFIDSLDAGFFANVDDVKDLTLEEMDSSCEPIYVRPPVFVNPVSKK